MAPGTSPVAWLLERPALLGRRPDRAGALAGALARPLEASLLKCSFLNT